MKLLPHEEFSCQVEGATKVVFGEAFVAKKHGLHVQGVLCKLGNSPQRHEGELGYLYSLKKNS